MIHLQRLAVTAVASIAAIGLATSTPVVAQNVTVVVNGQQVGFDQPPVERGGRVFVPLRGVFERLGASVVYDNGVINATGQGHNISLHIGSTIAVVDGSQQTLDVAPFLVGSRTLVPLRFISQALGANVDWNNSTDVVTITMGGVTATATPAVTSVSLISMRPAPNSVATARRPAVSGTFSKAVDPNSVRVTLDGRDVSSTTYVSSTQFLFSPPYDLTAATHTVRVTGHDADGNAFDRSWSFTSVAGGSTANYVTAVTPAGGATVGSSFTIAGTTIPYSQVHITAVGTTNMGGIFTVNTGSYSADVTADSGGHFSQQVSLNTASGGDVGVRITSVAPNTGAAATVTLQYHS